MGTRLYRQLQNLGKHTNVHQMYAGSLSFTRKDTWKTSPEEVYHEFSSREIPTRARVVICGGGVVGSSVAYHLAKDFGWKDVILLEQSRLGGGTSKHGAGILGQIKPTSIETKMCQYSIDLYKTLERNGLKTGWKGCGSLLLARTKDRMIYFQHLAASAVARKIDCQLLTPEEAQKHCPVISTDALEGGLWIPDDGVGDPFDICLTLASEAAKLGVTIVEGCSVQRVLTDDHRVTGIETNKGSITCEYFVNSGGYWGRHIGQLSYPRVKVPLYPCEHHYLHTMPVQDIDPMMPVIRDLDGCFYIREKNGCYLAGGFEPVSKPLDLKEIPDSFQPLPEDWDQFHILLEQMLFRIPSLGTVEVDSLCNGPESFSPDCKWILGEAPEVRNYFIASGMKAIGIEAAGGVGKLTADWIVNGEPHMDLWDVDIRRFLGLHNNRLFLRDRMVEVPGMHYKLKYPYTEFVTGRCIRMSPIYPRLKAAGAVFGQTMGYERPCYFKTPKEGTEEVEEEVINGSQTFFKPPWFDYLQSEYQACRKKVALLDYSSFTKLELWSPGREALELLQYLCSNDIDIPPNSIAHTGMQNQYGGYENDCSVVRLDENRFMIIAPTTQQTRCQAWIKRHLPEDSPVVLTDITSLYTSICVMGPLAQNVMRDLTDLPMSHKDFPFFTYKEFRISLTELRVLDMSFSVNQFLENEELNIGLANGIKAMNLTHTGELGYVLYIPNEYALHVYDELMTVGKKYGIQHAGYYAARVLRIEKFYAFWGQDLDTTTSPLECGREFRVKFDKGDFIGKKALLKQKAEGTKRKYVQLLLEDYNKDLHIWPWGGEPIYVNGKWAGLTTTSGFGFTLNKQICLGFIQNFDETGTAQVVTNDFVQKSNFEVDICGTRFAAKVNIHSPNISSEQTDLSNDPGGYMATQ